MTPSVSVYTHAYWQPQEPPVTTIHTVDYFLVLWRLRDDDAQDALVQQNTLGWTPLDPGTVIVPRVIGQLVSHISYSLSYQKRTSARSVGKCRGLGYSHLR